MIKNARRVFKGGIGMFLLYIYQRHVMETTITCRGLFETKELALEAWEKICSDYNVPETQITAPKIVFLPINNTTKKVLTNYWEN